MFHMVVVVTSLHWSHHGDIIDRKIHLYTTTTVIAKQVGIYLPIIHLTRKN